MLRQFVQVRWIGIAVTLRKQIASCLALDRCGVGGRLPAADVLGWHEVKQVLTDQPEASRVRYPILLAARAAVAPLS